MSGRIITSHIQEEGYRGPLVISLLAHLLVLGFFLFAADLFPVAEPLILGSGAGGGQGGEFVTVGLTAELGGGEGMYKPAVTPRPAAAPPPHPKEPEAPPKEPEPQKSVFVEKASAKKPQPVAKPLSSKPSQSRPSEAPAGVIPREPDPGSGGPGGKSAGAGGGFGGGQGVVIGAGTGEGTIDSWYVRRVEQRIGENWLKTFLGQLSRSVQTVISFEIQPNGHITNIQIDKTSGIRSVDLAAERAVRASHPLPQLPAELRHRRVKFVAHFEYPPR